MNSTLIWAQLLGFQLFFVFVVKKQILDPWFMCSCSRNSNSYLWVRESPGCKKKKKKNHCWHSADRSPVHVGSMLVKNSGMRSAPSRPEVFPGTPWSLQYCHTQQRQRGRGRLWAIHGTLLRETRNPFRRLTSCRPCLK